MHSIRQVYRTALIPGDMQLKEAIGRMRYRSGMPDVEREALPDGPETQETTCLACSCLECQSPSETHSPASWTRMTNSYRFLFFLHFKNENGAQDQYESSKPKNDTIAQLGLSKEIGKRNDATTQYGSNNGGQCRGGVPYAQVLANGIQRWQRIDG